MALTTTVGSVSSNSYVTVAEADVYLALRTQFASSSEYASWLLLSTAEKEDRLKQGTMLLDSLRFRGIKSCKAQALAFPRIFTGDDLYPTDDLGRESNALVDQYEDWTEVQEAADDEGVDDPTIPQEVKDVQIDLAFQVVHSYLMSLGPFESADYQADSVSVSKLSISVKSSDSSIISSLFDKSALDSLSIVKLKLQKYLAGRVRGVVL